MDGCWWLVGANVAPWKLIWWYFLDANISFPGGVGGGEDVKMFFYALHSLCPHLWLVGQHYADVCAHSDDDVVVSLLNADGEEGTNGQIIWILCQHFNQILPKWVTWTWMMMDGSSHQSPFRGHSLTRRRGLSPSPVPGSTRSGFMADWHSVFVGAPVCLHPRPNTISPFILSFPRELFTHERTDPVLSLIETPKCQKGASIGYLVRPIYSR